MPGRHVPVTAGARAQSLRRYPALSYLAGAAALALLLPSGLTLPQSGPTTLAELAPVPGQGQGQGDVSELGQAGSGRLGSGGGGAGRTTTTVAGGGADEDDDGPGGGRLVRKPGSKNCVGNPPRQTEDRLSPPCIAFFEGDNGGATSKGVTRDQVTVVLRGISDSTNPNYGGYVDCAEDVTPEDDPQDLACKAYQRYFNDRYQTYGRTVRMWVYRGLGMEDVDERMNPFAHVSPYSPGSDASRRSILSVGYDGTGRASYQRHAPYAISFRPDVEDEIAMAASYICLRLAHRPARFSGNPEDVGKTRRFGFWHDDSRSKPDALKRALKDQCNVDMALVAADRDDPSVPGRMRAEGVTTLLMMMSCGGGCYSLASSLAAQSAWFPEVVVPGDADSTRIDTNGQGRLTNQAVWANAIGITLDYRRDAMVDQPWYRAYREGCPDCPTPFDPGTAAASNTPRIYDALSMLFYGVQSAGPRLTPENLDRGLHAIPADRSTDPYKPAAYFAPGNYSFVKDAMAISWDPTGTPPGSGYVGCYRLPGEGRRYRAGEWPAGDGDVRGSGPCQSDAIQ